ncbi:MAG: hypothetical protein P0S96_00285 [Simkaniaceae bacterium]|nr:hypothetical protein [Candidatus Sacchlamyda saccharinae]
MEISKPGEDKSIYKKELQQGVRIFEESLKGYRDTKKFPEKKMEYEKAMKESFKAIQDACTALMSKELSGEKEQFSKDYQNYLSNPSAENANKIEKDLDVLRKSAS